MEIESLLRLMCARIASIMMELPIKQVRQIFGIETDMSDEEIEKFRKYII